MAVVLEGIRVLVFDLDDTLYAERSYAYSGFEAVGDWLRQRIACPVDPVARMRELFETGDRRRIFDTLLAEFGCPDPENLVPGMVWCYREHTPTIQLAPDAAELLRELKGLLHLGLVSDGPLAMQERKVAALCLSEWLDPIVLTDVWGTPYWKPHPRGFELIQHVTGCKGAACLYVADNAAKDFVAPRRLGWRTVQICRSEGVYARIPPHPDGIPEARVGTLRELEIRLSDRPQTAD